ncbi:MAG: hypothetical protein AAGI91_03815 [Bacteroidota bacterium]
MLKPPKPVSRRQELREDKVITAYARTMTMAEDNKGLLIAAAAGIVVIFLGVLGFTLYQGGQSDRADDVLGAILPAYESGSFQEALDGTPEALGLLDIADDYASTEAGNLARFYAAGALFELGRYDEAAAMYADYNGADLLGASALAGQAAIAEINGDHGGAGNLYRRAARAYESAATAPAYYLDAARNFEAAGDYGAARAAYEAIAEDYDNAPEAADLAVYTARLDALENGE